MSHSHKVILNIVFNKLTTTIFCFVSQFVGDWKLLLRQTMKLVSTGGFFQRPPSFCGHYVSSDHAASLILTYMFIKACKYS